MMKKQIVDLKRNNENKINEILKSQDNQIKTLKLEQNRKINKLNEEKFIFSIIIIIYNSEKYLPQAIDSILNQLFVIDNVEIILVDDGSIDSSSEICKNYVDMYPDNIRYIYQENQGLSASRNTGLNHAKGTFINFLDSYDKLEPQTLNEILYYFNKFGNEVDVISMPCSRFDAFEGEMLFYDKYTNSRIIDIGEEYDFPIIHINSAFLRRSQALKFEFDNRLFLFEDNHFITKLILEKGKFGVINLAKYLYRETFEKNAVFDSKKTDKRYFINDMGIYFNDLINYSLEKFGKVLRYVQSDLMHGLKILFLQNTEIGVLTDDEINEFYNNIREVLQFIDDDIILSQNFSKFIKNYILNIKYNFPGFNINLNEDDIFLNNGISFDKLSDNKIFIDEVLDDDYLVGSFKFYSDDITINAYDDNKKLDVIVTDIEKEVSMGNVISYIFKFEINLDLFKGFDNFKFELIYNSNTYPILFEPRIK